MQTNNTSPQISIIMPTYNRAAFIIETIESIINQTYKNWELIIIDDLSDDNTKELIDTIKDPRIKYYNAGRKIGMTPARNLGLEKQNHELIAFMDSDDLWATTKLQKQVDALIQYPEAKFCLTGGFNFRRTGAESTSYPGEIVEHFYKQTSGIKIDNLLVSYFQSQLSTTTASLIFWKECLETTGNLNKNKTYADVDFILNLAQHFKGIILYEPLFYRRLHNSNTSSGDWEKGYEEGIALIQLYKKVIPENIIKDAFFRLYINFGEDCLMHKQRIPAMNRFLKAWQYKPFSIVPLKKTLKAMLNTFSS